MKPSPDIKIHHHYADAGFDLEYTDWKPQDNPRYAGNIFQKLWWWVGTRYLVNDAHTIKAVEPE